MVLVDDVNGEEVSNARKLILDNVNVNNENVVMEYHPSANRETCVLPLEEFLDSSGVKQNYTFDKHPWHPFPSELDFQLAEFTLKTGLNHQERNTFFNLMDQCGDGKSTSYSIKNDKDLTEVWERADHLLTNVSL